MIKFIPAHEGFQEKWKSSFLLLAISAVLCLFGFGATNPTSKQKRFAGMTVVPLNFGPNKVDMNGDGVNDVIFLGRRENFNAHGFTTFTFYIDTDNTWYIVPFDNKKDAEEKEYLSTSEGADGFLQDIRVLVPDSSSNAPTTIVVGVRDFGESFADAAPVKFIIYQLTRNDEGIPGWPPFYFQETQTIHGRKKYNDINQAFLSELGLKPYSSFSQPNEE